MQINEFDNYEYLNKNNIKSLEDLVGRAVYVAYPSLGVKGSFIKRIEYTRKSSMWNFVTNAHYHVSELGNGFFFSKEEARTWQLAKLDEYTKAQRESILYRERLLKEQELKELENLLIKYPEEANTIMNKE